PAATKQEPLIGVVEEIGEVAVADELAQELHAPFLALAHASGAGLVGHGPRENRGVRRGVAALAPPGAAPGLFENGANGVLAIRGRQRGDEQFFLGLPFGEEGAEELAAIAEVPVEAALGH